MKMKHTLSSCKKINILKENFAIIGHYNPTSRKNTNIIKLKV
jgi:hypothetical protein